MVHYGPPRYIDDYCQESGRARRDGTPSHALLFTFPKCTSGRLSVEMKAAVKNDNVCRPTLIMKAFGTVVGNNSLKKHDCCDICSRTCTCHGETCSLEDVKEQYMSDVELHHKNQADEITQRKKDISSEMSALLEERLIIYRESLTDTETKSFVTEDIITGFPLCAIKETLSIAASVESAEDIWMRTSLLDKTHALFIFNLLTEIQSNATLAPEVEELPQNNQGITENKTSSDASSDSDFDVEDSDESDTSESERLCRRRTRHWANFISSSDESSDIDSS